MSPRGIIIKFILFVLCLSLIPIPSVPSSPLYIHFIDIGDGDSTLIITPSGENILIDTGSPLSVNRLIKYLRSLGIERIDHLILTHPHYDHIGGLFGLIPRLQVGKLYDSGLCNLGDDMYRDYVSVVRQDLSRYRLLQAGESLDIGDVRIDVINPILPPTGDPNTDSIALRLTYGEMKVLFTGDMTSVAERRLLKLGVDLRSQVIKLAHHGENDTTSKEFLMAVKPEYAIISVSRSDIYARPHPALITRLEEAGVKVFRTDQDGTIILETDGREYRIRRLKPGTRS
jgi:competence protein ComEC